MNKNKVSTKQKIIAYLFLFLVVITFSTMRNHKSKMNIEKNYNILKSVETSLTNSIKHLYNEDIHVVKCEFIDNDYRQKLINKFSETNSLISKESLKLSYVKFNNKKIYKTKIDGEPFIIYSGTLDMQWSYTNKESNTATVTKQLTGYLKEDSNNYLVADINITDIKD